MGQNEDDTGLGVPLARVQPLRSAEFGRHTSPAPRSAESADGARPVGEAGRAVASTLDLLVRPATAYGAVTDARRLPSALLCGHWALSYVTGHSLDTVIARLGHHGPTPLREIEEYARRYAGLQPTVCLGDVLRCQPSETWYRFGGDGFQAILGDTGMGTRGEIGHAVVLHGRLLLDGTGAGVIRVSPRVLADYDVAYIFSAPGARPEARS